MNPSRKRPNSIERYNEQVANTVRGSSRRGDDFGTVNVNTAGNCRGTGISELTDENLRRHIISLGQGHLVPEPRFIIPSGFEID